MTINKFVVKRQTKKKILQVLINIVCEEMVNVAIMDLLKIHRVLLYHQHKVFSLQQQQIPTHYKKKQKDQKQKTNIQENYKITK
jgi:hypothetical protein